MSDSHDQRCVSRPHTKLYYHAVWATWDRAPLITRHIERRMHGAIAAKCADCECTALAVGGVEDHVHLLVRAPPTGRPCTLVGEIKGVTSFLMNSEIAPGHVFRWQGGYGLFTVSPTAIDQVRDYILHQREHHDRGTTDSELEISTSNGDDTE